eukprot:Hpha_TRINITY_DN17284_c0_g1::TRINITY_DN17284_c0_g1_i1::g.17826::m.17826
MEGEEAWQACPLVSRLLGLLQKWYSGPERPCLAQCAGAVAERLESVSGARRVADCSAALRATLGAAAGTLVESEEPLYPRKRLAELVVKAQRCPIVDPFAITLTIVSSASPVLAAARKSEAENVVLQAAVRQVCKTEWKSEGVAG